MNEEVKIEALRNLTNKLLRNYSNRVLDDMEEDDLSTVEYAILELKLDEAFKKISPDYSTSSVEFTSVLVLTLSTEDINEQFSTLVEDAVKEIIETRVKYYEVEVEFSGRTTVYIKAQNDFDAKEYAEDMSTYDLLDIIESGDLGIDGVTVYDGQEDEPWGEWLDATE